MICLKSTFLVAALSLLTACGGGGSDTPEVDVVASGCVPAGPTPSFTYPGPTPPAASLPMVTESVEFSIDLFGDSTNWLAYAYWRGAFGNKVTLHAQRGTKSADLVAGTDGINQPWPQSVDAQVMVVNHGMNDAAVPVPIADYKANLRKFAQTSAVVIFETPNPSTSVDTAPYAQAMREVAAETGSKLIDTQACMLRRADWATLLYDGVHPTDEGRKYIVETCVNPIIRSLQCK